MHFTISKFHYNHDYVLIDKILETLNKYYNILNNSIWYRYNNNQLYVNDGLNNI